MEKHRTRTRCGDHQWATQRCARGYEARCGGTRRGGGGVRSTKDDPAAYKWAEWHVVSCCGAKYVCIRDCIGLLQPSEALNHALIQCMLRCLVMSEAAAHAGRTGPARQHMQGPIRSYTHTHVSSAGPSVYFCYNRLPAPSTAFSACRVDPGVRLALQPRPRSSAEPARRCPEGACSARAYHGGGRDRARRRSA